LEYQDTYFLHYDEAYKIAQQQNKMHEGDGLQVCYYDGQYHESDLVNLVHLPIENMIEYLSMGIYRLPTTLSFNGTDFSHEVQNQILMNFQTCIQKAAAIRNELSNYYIQELQNKKLNFNEPLRFFFMGHVNTLTMQHVSKNLSNALEKIGCEVYYQLDYGCHDNNSLKELFEFNPHVTFNINHLNNQYISDEVFNFIWFQDFMPILLNKYVPLNLRKRDIVLSLYKDIDILLERKNVSFIRQHFCAAEDLFYEDGSIERENKIVFIGHRANSDLDDVSEDLLQEAREFFEKSEILDMEKVFDVAKRYLLDPFYVYTIIFPIVIRELAIEWMCEVSPIPVEVYGDDAWLDHPVIGKHLKRRLSYGDEIREVYNSAKYVLVSQPKYLRNQRLFEGVACGCIPVVYDCRPYEDPPHYDDEILYFNSKEQMRIILEEVKETKENPKNILNNNRYSDLANKLYFMIKQFSRRR